jgi:hypothetical protein
MRIYFCRTIWNTWNTQSVQIEELEYIFVEQFGILGTLELFRERNRKIFIYL